jgi:adenylate cyclase
VRRDDGEHRVVTPEGRSPRPDLAELTGELPRFVRDAMGRPQPVGPDGRPQLGEEDAATVQALVDLGLDADDARQAVEEDRVALVLAQRVIGGRPRYSIEQISERSGVPVALLRRIRVATGLPFPERFGRVDLQWARLLARLLEVLPPEAVAASARARGTALATVARSDLGMVRDELLLPMRQAGADDLTVAVALAETARELDSVARELLQITYGLHLEHQLSSELSATLTRAEVPEITLAVGFVDVVGWTSLSSRIDPQGLDEVLDAFEERVIAVTAPRGEVSVVKFLGDAAMFVAADPLTLTEAMLELTTAVPALEDVPLRGGLACGTVLVREGDVFGAPVNLAARLTDLARPWRLLADESLQEQLDDGGYRTRRLRPMRIRGVGTMRPLGVRAAATD